MRGTRMGVRHVRGHVHKLLHATHNVTRSHKINRPCKPIETWRSAEQTFALTKALSSCGAYFDLMLNAPRFDCSLPFAFFLACRSANYDISSDHGWRLMEEKISGWGRTVPARFTRTAPSPSWGWYRKQRWVWKRG